jgi:hypothetical protein
LLDDLVLPRALQIEDVYLGVALELHGKLTVDLGHVDDVAGFVGGV